jgi:exonuclease III
LKEKKCEKCYTTSAAAAAAIEVHGKCVCVAFAHFSIATFYIPQAKKATFFSTTT